jgi:hypothetical protein
MEDRGAEPMSVMASVTTAVVAAAAAVTAAVALLSGALQ